MHTTAQTSLPPEVTDIIAALLHPHHLAACVQVNQEWSHAFLPILWRNIQICERYLMTRSESKEKKRWRGLTPLRQGPSHSSSGSRKYVGGASLDGGVMGEESDGAGDATGEGRVDRGEGNKDMGEGSNSLTIDNDNDRRILELITSEDNVASDNNNDDQESNIDDDICTRRKRFEPKGISGSDDSDNDDENKDYSDFNDKDNCWDEDYWTDDKDDFWPHKFPEHKRWFNCTKEKIELGGMLEKYGHLVRKVKCESFRMVELLASHVQSCPGLVELEVRSDFFPPSSMTRACSTSEPLPVQPELQSLTAILRQLGHLQSLKLHGQILSESNIDLVEVIESIPESVERLELHCWDPIYSERLYTWNQDQMQETVDSKDDGDADILDQPTQPLRQLKELVFYSYAVDHNKRTLSQLLRRCPNVETIRLQGISKVVQLQPLASLLSRHCPKVTHLLLMDWCGSNDKDFASILDASQTGWRTFGFPRTWDCRYIFGPLSCAALLKNATTLENIRLDSAFDLPSATIQQLFSSAPNLKRFDAIADDRTRECEAQLEARDIVEGQDWVCTGLESLKLQIAYIPRPDITTHMNGRPFNNSSRISQKSIASSRRIQHAVYTQLGRLTQLKQLVLGHDDVDRENGCEERERFSEGKYYDRDLPLENGHQYKCLEMTLESGMGVLEGLKQLRKLELGAMAVGSGAIVTWEIENESRLWFDEDDEGDDVIDDVPGEEKEVKEDERTWMKKNWPLLDHQYKDEFWTRLGYLDYY